MEDMVKDRVEQLDRRLARIEAFLATLGMPAAPEASPAPVAPPETPPPAVKPPPLPPVARPLPPVASHEPQIVEMPDERGAPVLREVFPEENRFGEIVQPAEAEPAQPASKTGFTQAAQSVSYERPAPFYSGPPVPNAKHEAFTSVFTTSATPASRPMPQTSVEQAIGLKLAGWIGAIILVIGAAMGVKYAYDQGWLGGLPDQVKLGLYYAIGIALIGAGEYVYRRVEKVAAVGLYAAGIAGLFVVSYAGNAYYQLYEQSAAFTLMAGSCAIGALISLRGGLVSIAVLSLLGANIAPVILRNRAVGEVPLLVYLLTLQVLALGLAHVGKGARWWILRNFALVTLSLWMAGRLMSPATAFSLPTLLFVCLYAALFQVENALAARKQGQSAFSHPTFSFAVTAALTVALLRWSMPLSDVQRGATVVLLSFIAFTAGAAAFYARQERLRHLAQSWLVQGGILLFAAVPVALSGPWIFVAWALMALGYAVLGAVLERAKTAGAGVIIWFAAVLLLVLRLGVGARSDSLRRVAFELGSTPLPVYLVIGLLIAAIGYAISLVIARRFASKAAFKQLDGLPAILAVSATLVAAAVCQLGLPSQGVTLAGIAVAWLCFALANVATSTANVYRALSGAVITITLARWVAIDLIAQRVSSHEVSGLRLVFNATFGLGLACVVSLWAIARLSAPRLVAIGETSGRLVAGALLLGLFAICLGLSFEIERGIDQAYESGRNLRWPAGQLTGFAWTVLWAIAAVALPWLGKLMAVPAKLRDELKVLSTFVLSVITAVFLVRDCLMPLERSRDVSAGLLINAQTVTGLLLLGLLIFAARTTSHPVARGVARAMIFLLPLVVGSIELSRIVGREKTLVAFSVYWGLYAILSIGVGFGVRAAVLRYAGLGLLGITLLKIVLVDLANAGTGWRILSFLGVGSILLATSVLYGKLSPILLAKSKNESGTTPPSTELA